ncbi:MAG TPA: aldo/keto reductase [Armatimonadota bacterium]|nr:aldo/keto reductase [Armatimonadota bacterium]
MNRRILGRTGIEVSELSIGTGTEGYGHSSQQTRLGRDELSRLLRFAYDSGITFWDAADGYGSHEALGMALKGLRRDTVEITSKTTSRTPAAIREDVHRFCRELGTDYIDILMLHCLTQHNWPTRYADCMDEMTRLKEEGLIRAVGCSCHDFTALKLTSECPWVEVNLARINYGGKHMDASPDEVIPVLRKMHADGKGLYGMKVLGQGSLARDPERAIEFVLNLGCVDAITIGMTSDDQVRRNIAIIERLTGALARAA